jgi:hypothetical protein
MSTRRRLPRVADHGAFAADIVMADYNAWMSGEVYAAAAAGAGATPRRRNRSWSRIGVELPEFETF